MGQLAKSVTGGGLNAASLAGLLSSQQGNIASALPAGLGSALSSAGVLGGDFAGQARATLSALKAQVEAAGGTLANSAVETRTGALAGSVFGDWGFAGLSVSRLHLPLVPILETTNGGINVAVHTGTVPPTPH